MFYLVQTNFCIGIFTNERDLGFCTIQENPIIAQYMTIEEARKALEERIVLADFGIRWKDMVFNRLYKIYDTAYTVVYTKAKMGFTKSVQLKEFLTRYRIKRYCCQSRLTYKEAVDYMLYGLSDSRGRNRHPGEQKPQCGCYYKRASF